MSTKDGAKQIRNNMFVNEKEAAAFKKIKEHNIPMYYQITPNVSKDTFQKNFKEDKIMAEPTVLGYIKEQPERLKYVFENKDVFVKPFVDVFTKNNIKKVIFFGSGTSYNVSILGTYYFKHLVGIDAE